jgi:aryl-alcohol dehydrogenase-like predicted oxidoreductase
MRVLGNSDLLVSPVGLGSWVFGGSGWKYCLGPQDDNESIRTIHAAFDLGINWIDTAAVYGLGHSLKVVARAVQSYGRKPYIFTKCSVLWREDGSLYNSLKTESVTEEVEGLLRCLGVETLDLCQVHWPEPENEIEEGWEALARLREQGKIRWIGVSNFSVRQMKRIQKIAPITSLQPPYSLLNRDTEAEVLPFALANGIGVISYSPMCSGLLTMIAADVAALPADDWRLKIDQFREPRLSRNLRLVQLLREIGNRHGVSSGVVAIAWVLHHPAITGVIVGARRLKELEYLAPALHFRLSQDEYDRIGRYLKSIRWYLASIYARLMPAS